MEISVITLFPEIFAVVDYGILGRAKEKGLYNLNILNPRDFTDDSYRTVDDYPFGGGVGMVMKVKPIIKAYETFVSNHQKPFVVLTDPRGQSFDNDIVDFLIQKNSLMIICGRYEGIDERISNIVDLKLSIGNFVLSGGEIPALAIIDAVVRKIPGAIGKQKSYMEDSYSMGMLDHSHYTRPSVINSMEVPKVLLSGNHKKIEEYRFKERLLATLMKDSSILEEYEFSQEEMKMIEKLSNEFKHLLKKRENNA